MQVKSIWIFVTVGWQGEELRKERLQIAVVGICAFFRINDGGDNMSSWILLAGGFVECNLLSAARHTRYRGDLL